MSEQAEVIAEFRDAGVLAGVRWAYESATRRALESYSEADGHDAAWLGHTRFTLFRDRLDRVFSCMRYAVSADEELDLDVRYAELSDADRVTMPRLAPGLVRRSDLFGSAGWAYRRRRFLLAGGDFGRLDTLPWPNKSRTKQIVALQRNPDVRQPSLFESLLPADGGPGESGGPAESGVIDPALLTADRELDLLTYVIAHSLDPFSGEAELVFGRPRLNLGGGPAWYWREDLLAPPLARPVDPGQVPDAPVRLRRPEGGVSDVAG